MFSGDEGNETNFEGLYASPDTYGGKVLKLEDSGLFVKVYNLNGPGQVYATAGLNPDSTLDVARDYTLKLDRGEGIWITVEDEDGNQLSVKVGIDFPTGALALRAFSVDKEDEDAIDSALASFT